MAALGEKLTRARWKRQIRAVVLAKETGISVGYLSNLETGRATNPSTHVLTKLAAALSVPMSYLIDPEAHVDTSVSISPIFARVAALNDVQRDVLTKLLTVVESL